MNDLQVGIWLIAIGTIILIITSCWVVIADNLYQPMIDYVDDQPSNPMGDKLNPKSLWSGQQVIAMQIMMIYFIGAMIYFIVHHFIMEHEPYREYPTNYRR